MIPFGEDTTKWYIHRGQLGWWHVDPPVGLPTGLYRRYATGAHALEGFRRQTATPTGFPKVVAEGAIG